MSDYTILRDIPRDLLAKLILAVNSGESNLQEMFPEISAEQLEAVINAVEEQKKEEDQKVNVPIFPARGNFQMQVDIFNALRMAETESDTAIVIKHYSETEKWLSTLEMKKFSDFVNSNRTLIDSLEKAYTKMAKKDIDRKKIYEILCDSNEFYNESPKKIKYIIKIFAK